MSSTKRSFWATLAQTSASTSESADDPRLRGRTYSIPFEDVWREAVALSKGALRGWSLVQTDDHEGIIEAEAKPFILPGINDVTVHITLDENAQTRVDVRSASRDARFGMGTNHRHIERFLRALDQSLERRARSARATRRKQ